MEWQREIMRHADTCAQRHLTQLHRHRIRCKRNTVNTDIDQIVQLAVKDHIGNIANHTMAFDILERPDFGMRSQIVARCDQMQFIIGDLLHQKTARSWCADSYGHVGLAPGQVDHTWQGKDLNIQIRVGIADFRANLRQKVVGRSIRRADPYLTAERLGRARHGSCCSTHRLFGFQAVFHQPRARFCQQIALLRLGKQRGVQRSL